MRLATIAVFASLVSTAPLQCRRTPDPNVRREDTAGDALWALAQDFDAKGNPEGRKQTLRFLVERYPSNRHAPEARAQLGESAANSTRAPEVEGDAGKR